MPRSCGSVLLAGSLRQQQLFSADGEFHFSCVREGPLPAQRGQALLDLQAASPLVAKRSAICEPLRLWAARNRADPRSFSSAPSGRIGLLGGRRHASILRTVFLLSPVFRGTPRREPPSSKTRRRTYAHCLGSRYIALLALYLNKREVYPGDGVSLNFKQQRLDVPALSARRWIGLLCNSSFSASAPTMIQEIEFARDSPLEGDGFELPVPVRQAKLTRSCR
jgi:hypothetical protein